MLINLLVLILGMVIGYLLRSLVLHIGSRRSQKPATPVVKESEGSAMAEGDPAKVPANIRQRFTLSPSKEDVTKRKITQVSIGGNPADSTLDQELTGEDNEFEIVAPHGATISGVVIDVNEDGVESDPASFSAIAKDSQKPVAPTISVAEGSAE